MLALNAQFGVGAGGKRGEEECSDSTGLSCLRSQGAPQWHGESDPVCVETCSCAGLFPKCGDIPEADPVRIRLEPALRCKKRPMDAWAKALSAYASLVLCAV